MDAGSRTSNPNLVIVTNHATDGRRDTVSIASRIVTLKGVDKISSECDRGLASLPQCTELIYS